MDKSAIAPLSIPEAAERLAHASETGILGSGPKESPIQVNPIKAALSALPLFKLFIQFVWSSAIVVSVFFLVRRDETWHTFDARAWDSRISVPSSVTSGVGWCLFVLLGFYVNKATRRYQDAARLIYQVGHAVRYNARTLLHACKPGTWHTGDLDRIIRHFIAYPIALKMTIRGEREREQLDFILHPRDVDNVLAAESMHSHCMRVIRAYSLAIDSATQNAFQYSDTETAPCGRVSIYSLIDALDKADFLAQEAVSLSESRSSITYVNHLRIFLYIWMMFLPLSLVSSSGW